MSPQPDAPDDYPVPDVRPVDVAVLADHLHDTMRRLNAAYFQAVSAERAFEKHRGDVVAAYTADGTAITTAERHARIDPECQRLETRLIDARANIARLEAFAVHWRFLIEHAPGH